MTLDSELDSELAYERYVVLQHGSEPAAARMRGGSSCLFYLKRRPNAWRIY